MEELREENSELWNGIRVYSSRYWDMDIPPEQLFESNKTCRFYECTTNADIKDTDAYKPYAIYLKHPVNDRYVGVGVCNDGFVYMFDGNPSLNIPEVKTVDAVKFLMNYMNFIRAYEDFHYECITSNIATKEIRYTFVENKIT